MITALLSLLIAFQTFVDGDITMVLLDDEAVLCGVALETGTVEVSQDAMSWTTPSQNFKDGAVRFAPVPVRALRIKNASGAIRLIHADSANISVSDVSVTEITEGSAVIRWKTSFPVKTALLYGYRRGHMKDVGGRLEVTTDHEVRLSNLFSGIEYTVFPLIGEKGGDPIVFRTKGIPLPFAHDELLSTGRDTAAIRFKSNIPSSAWLEWKDGSRTPPTRRGLDHLIELTGLLPRTTYEYQIVTKDAAERATATPWMMFTTKSNNAAVHKPVSGTFVRVLPDQTCGGLERITDGRLDYFEGMATSGDLTETDQWAEVDLGVAKEITTVETIWRGNAYPKGFYILTSLDRENWSYPGFGLDAGAGSAERSERGDPLLRVAAVVDQKIRYVKVFVPKGSDFFTRWDYIQLAEIEAHEKWKAK